jgi:zona occludens toxin (predicted ATPase)
LGRAYQLICNGFSFTGLITDIKVLEQVLATVRFKGAHYVFSVGQRLPKLTIDLFQKSNGVIIKVGDVTHPDSLEIIATYPDWAERNERLFEQLDETLKQLLQPAPPKSLQRGDSDYVS